MLWTVRVQFPRRSSAAGSTGTLGAGEGDSALHACESLGAAQLLLAAGAALGARNQLGMLPIQTMAANDADELVEAIRPNYDAAGIPLPVPLVPSGYLYGEMMTAHFVDADGDVETDFPDA